MEAFKKTVVPGTLDGGKVYVEIDWDGKRLSICGKSRYGSGQIDLDPDEIKCTPPWNIKMLTRLKEIWSVWHLNDMKAGCAHQRAEGWGSKELELVTYEPPKLVGGMTANPLQLKDHMKGLLGVKPLPSNVWKMAAEVYRRAVAKPKNPDDPRILWFIEKFNYGWVRQDEHPEGKLARPCPTCGYAYGTKWLHEDVPEDVLTFLREIPEIQTAGKSSYEIEAEEFLSKHGITFKATFKGDKCPLWCDGEHAHGDHYAVTFRRKGEKSLSFSFWNSLNDSEAGNTPTPYDVLASIEKSDPGSFEDFCGEFGYDTDSRKAEKTYKLVEKQWEKVSAFFNGEELEELWNIN